jgi:energy-coupling factor transporter transmembrane protein EcfT
LGNLIGYRASRRGLHGKLYLHQRTGLLVQMGRYAALTLLLVILAACSASIFIAGTAIASLTSTLRQLIWLRKVPGIPEDDLPPEAG